MNKKYVVALIISSLIFIILSVFVYKHMVVLKYKTVIQKGVKIEGIITKFSPKMPTRYYEGETRPFEIQIKYTDPYGFSRDLLETVYFDTKGQQPEAQDKITIYFMRRTDKDIAVSEYNEFIRKIIP